MQHKSSRRDSLNSTLSSVTASSLSLASSHSPLIHNTKDAVKVVADERDSKRDGIFSFYNRRIKRDKVLDKKSPRKRNDPEEIIEEEPDDVTVLERGTKQKEGAVYEIPGAADDSNQKDIYIVKIKKLKEDMKKHKNCWKRMFVSFISLQLIMVLLTYSIIKLSHSKEDSNFLDPYFEEVLTDRMVSSQDFRTKINETVFCLTCRYNYGDGSLWYRNEKGECCIRDIATVVDLLKEIFRSKTDILKERVQDLEELRDNLNVIANATNSSEHITVVQNTASSVSSELLQELFSRKKSAIHLRDSGEFKKVGHEYHVLWSNVDTTKRNLDVSDSGSTVTIATEGFYFLYCKIMFFKYGTTNDTIHEPLTYQIRRKRSGTAFLLEETRQKWEQVGETMEYQSSAQMVYKLDAGDMIYVCFPGNQIQHFNTSSHGSHTLGLFEL